MRMSVPDISSQLAVDVKALNDLKREARSNTPTANKAVAQQFEALFLQTVLKAMRDATPRDGLFDSEQSRMFESMYDQQLTQVLATKGRGTGLAALIEKQLSRLNGDVQPLGDLPFLPKQQAFPLLPSAETYRRPDVVGAVGSMSMYSNPLTAAGHNASPAAREFVERIWPHALETSRAIGIPAHFMVAQAALETGWGKAEPRMPDGGSSHNLFGLKAGSNWKGPVVTATTTEFIDGRMQKQVERFRAYASDAEAFRDYANLLTSNPRYAGVLGAQDASAFAMGLQRSGYATDPLYATKLAGIIGGATLRSSLLEG